MVTIDRASAARLGIKPAQIDNTLYDAFGQRQVSTIYNPLNQYHVVMEVAPKYWQSPDMLNQIYVSTSGGSASGAQTTNATAGTVTRRWPTPAARAPSTRRHGGHDGIERGGDRRPIRRAIWRSIRLRRAASRAHRRGRRCRRRRRR